MDNEQNPTDTDFPSWVSERHKKVITEGRIYAIHEVVVPIVNWIEQRSELMTLEEANAALPEWQARGDGKEYIVNTVWIPDNY